MFNNPLTYLLKQITLKTLTLGDGITLHRVSKKTVPVLFFE